MPAVLGDTLYIDTVLGLVFILVYAIDRFNTPPTNRSSTTAVRYYTGALFYCLFGLLVYSVLVKWPHLTGVALQGDQNAIPSWAKNLSSPLLVALMLTVALPKIPLLSAADEWIRDRIQKMAAIPYEVRVLGAQLRKADFSVAGETRERIRAALIKTGFRPEDILFEKSDAPQYLWTKLAVLMDHLQAWEGERKFVGFIASFSPQWNELKRKRDQMVSRAQQCFELMRDFPVDRPLGKDPIIEYRRLLEAEMEEVLQSVYDFISRGVLQCELTLAARRERIKRLGLEVDIEASRLTLNQLVWVFFGVNVVALGGLVLFREPGQGQINVVKAFLMSLMIAAIYVVAVWMAIYPRQHWQFAARDERGGRPALFYLVAGLLTVAGGAPISFGVKILLYKFSVVAAWEDFATHYPWLFLSFMTAMITAFLVDDRPSTLVPLDRLRWVEAVAQAILTMLSGVVVYYWLRATPGATGVPPLGAIVGLSGVIGFVIGVLVPTWYRSAPREPEAVEEAQHGAVLGLGHR